MPRWTDLAQWVGPTVNCGDGDSAQNEPGDRVADHMYVVLHIAQGSYAGTVAWQRNPDANVSSHFIVAKDGRCAQMVDTSIRAWTQAAGNPYSISIEFEGWVPDKLTAQQLEVAARILARAHQVHGIPLQVTNRVGTRGLGHHSMGAESGVNWGHSQCPGTSIKAQKQTIVDRAADIVNGVSDMDPSDERYLRQQVAATAWLSPTFAAIGTGDDNQPVPLTALLRKLETAAAADESRDLAVKSLLEAMAAAGGFEVAPIVTAINGLRTETLTAVTSLQDQVAELQQQLGASRIREERLAAALAAAGAELDAADG